MSVPLLASRFLWFFVIYMSSFGLCGVGDFGAPVCGRVFSGFWAIKKLRVDQYG